MFCRGKLARPSLFLLFILASSPLPGKELTTSYYSYADGKIYQSLHAAESALWNAPFIGSTYYEYLYTEGRTRKYQHPPTTRYFEDPRLVLWSSPGHGCNDCPLYDRFGNDRCSSAPWGRGCASEENWWASVQEAFSSIDCPPVKTGEGPWELDFLGKIAYPMVFPGEYLMLQARYSRFIDAEFPPGNSALCGTNHDFVMTAIAPAYCEAYPDFRWVDGIGYQCLDNRVLGILAFGAEQAEPGPNACAVGNPCHPATGDKTLTETDFDSATLPFARHYHSRQIYPDYAAMGKGWSHTYSGRLIVEGRVIKVIDGEGNAERFRCTDSPGCTAWASESEPGHLLRPLAGGWEVYLKSGELRRYDTAGKLVLITDRSGGFREIAVTYNADGRVSRVTDPSGRSLQFTYDTNDLLESVTLPDSGQIHYGYASPASDTAHNSRFNLVRVIRQDLTERLYHYEDRHDTGTARHGHLLTGITDENGVRFASYTYDHKARVTSSEHAGGAGRVELNYTRRDGESFEWSITEVTEPLGEVAIYSMEPGPFRKPTGIEDSRGDVVMHYDPATTWRTSLVDREGSVSTFSYDSLHEISRTEAAGTADQRVIETDWDDTINRVLGRREPGRETRYTYNSRGQVLTRTVRDTETQDSRTWTYAYIEPPSLVPLIGQIRSVDGPRRDVDDVTTYEYYTTDHPGGDYLVGDLKAAVNALGHRTDYLRYDGNGRPLEIQDANGHVTILGYHSRGWIKSRTTGGGTTWFSYDGVGNLTRLTHPDGRYLDFQYDDAHRLIAMADKSDNRVEWTLDAGGNRISERIYDGNGALRHQLDRIYDTLNRLAGLIGGNGDQIRYGYDGNGNRTVILDANLNPTAFEYDPLDRLVKAIDSNLGETWLDYDDRDNLVSVTDPLGNVTRYHFDGLDNQTRLESPDTGVTGYEHDDAGNTTAATDARGIRAEYHYDALNRLTGISYPDGTLDVSFTYDAGKNGKGRLSRMTDNAGTVDYAWDARGNLLGESRNIGLTQYRTRYAYNDADRLVGIRYPSGMVLHYTLDAAGRITAIDTASETLISDVRYEPFGPVTSFTYGNGLTHSAAFDRDYKLKSIRSGWGLDWKLGYDNAGNILSITDQAGGQQSQVFTYDDLYRLESARGSRGDESFEYDANGNRTRHVDGIVGVRLGYEPQSNRLVFQNGWTYTRDLAGNRTGKLDTGGYGQLYRFADHARLSRISVLDGSTEKIAGKYIYDGRGRRVTKTIAGATTHYIFGPSGELLGEYRDDGLPIREYIYLNGQAVALIDTETTAVPAGPSDIVLDNDGPGTSTTSSWRLESDKRDYGANYRLGNKAGTYRWTPPPISGTFEVYAWWVSNDKNSKTAHYSIIHDGKHDVVVRNHEKNGGKWNLLGTFTFDGSGSEYVELHSGDGRKITADAIRFAEPAGGQDDVVTGANTYFIHMDHLGTPRMVSDDFQSIVWRWDFQPFGDAPPDEDPDGDLEAFTLNLRFPGQYYDKESGLHYNYHRTYDPATGRYIESDPIGLSGGLNTYAYALNAPVQFVDPDGLKVSGIWMKQPKLNVTDYGLTGGEFITPYLTQWGYLKVFRLYGYAAGYVNVDVRCEDSSDCGERAWEIHRKIGVSFRGYKDVGPNVAASAAGSAATPVAGVATSVVTLGGSALTSLLDILREIDSRGGDKIQWLYAAGPTAICLGTQ